MMLHIYGGMRGAAKYGLDADVLLEEALLDGFRVWIDPDGWYRGDPIGKCAWSGWKAKPVGDRPEAWKYAGASKPVILVNPECRDGSTTTATGTHGTPARTRSLIVPAPATNRRRTTLHDQQNTRPAPELSPDELLTVIEFGIHEPEYETAGAES